MFPYLSYQNHQLYIEKASFSSIAEQFGTPCYIYSKNSIVSQYQLLQEAFADLPCSIHYAVKANSNLSLLTLLKNCGCHFDIVSQGELERVLKIGGPGNSIVFSGVGKNKQDIARALDTNIASFHIESLAELHHIQAIAKEKNQIAPIAFRINPDIAANTHPYIVTAIKSSKFGIPIENALEFYEIANSLSHIRIEGIAFHLGSQLFDPAPLLEATEKTVNLIDKLEKKGIFVKYLDIGGGFGVTYQDERPFDLKDYAKKIKNIIGHRKLSLIIEPGRSLIANAGFLLTKVEYIKDTETKNFAIVDAAMNDLIRPSLYEAWHQVLPIQEPSSSSQFRHYDIVGPVCESGDFLAKNRLLPINQHDLLVVCSAGAYGSVMSSNYNSRLRPAEIMVDNDRIILIKHRETYEDLMRLEL